MRIKNNYFSHRFRARVGPGRSHPNGAFSSTPAEALACGTPVVLHTGYHPFLEALRREVGPALPFANFSSPEALFGPSLASLGSAFARNKEEEKTQSTPLRGLGDADIVSRVGKLFQGYRQCSPREGSPSEAYRLSPH